MPSTYAHYRMGLEVKNALNGHAVQVIEAYNDLYMIGLHGPDILFYYGALWSNPVNAVGFGLHEKSGRSFFESACKAIERSNHKDAALAYAYGVLNHFALDTTCHKYVDEKIASSGVTHTEIEVEFDRYLMILDGHDPVSHVLTDHIHPSLNNAEIISQFYPGITAKQVETSLKSMISYNKLLLAKSAFKKELIYTLLKLTGNYKEMHGLIVNPDGNPVCADSNQKLKELYEQAKTRAVAFIDAFGENLNENVPFDSIFDYDFGGRLKSIKGVK